MKVLDRMADPGAPEVEIPPSSAGMPQRLDINPESVEVSPHSWKASGKVCVFEPATFQPHLEYSPVEFEVRKNVGVIEIANGIWNLSNENYHLSCGLSRSALWEFRKSPYHYWYKYLSGKYVAPEKSEALLLGEVVHTAILEPHEFDSRYVVSPKFDRRTKAGKNAAFAFETSLAGKIVIPESMHQQAVAMAESVRESKLCKMFDLSGGDYLIERSVYFDYKGHQCKVRPDAWKRNLVVDVKTTNDASPKAFQMSAYKYGYFLQVAMMKKALESQFIDDMTFAFLVIEKEPPYAIGVYIMEPEHFELAEALLDELLSKYDVCKNNDDWPSYGINALRYPPFALQELPPFAI